MPAPTKSRTLALPSGGTGLHSAGRSRRPDSQGFVHGDDPSSPKLHVSVSTSALNPFITLTSYKTLHGSQHAAPTQGGSNSSPATPTGASSSKPRSPYMVKPSHLQHASAERRCAASKSGVKEEAGRAPHPQECAHLSALAHVLHCKRTTVSHLGYLHFVQASCPCPVPSYRQGWAQPGWGRRLSGVNQRWHQAPAFRPDVAAVGASWCCQHRQSIWIWCFRVRLSGGLKAASLT